VCALCHVASKYPYDNFDEEGYSLRGNTEEIAKELASELQERIEPNLYAALERWAADEFRSVNAHIEFLLRQALIKAGRLPLSEKERFVQIEQEE